MDQYMKKPYEISLWEDRITYVTNTREYIGKMPPANETIIAQYYKEIKTAIIGSDTMTSPIRAFEPKLVRNINGTASLTFSIYSHYYDEEQEELLDNPYKNMLINERKIKLRYGTPSECEWFDFVIKDVSEDSDSKVFTYTAKDLFINELSKNGFSLQFDEELENNIGNINTLANRVLEESDWKLEENVPVLEQKKEEPVYEIVLANDFTAKNIKDEYPSISLKKGDQIYVFYSVIENKENYLQFIYSPNGKYELDDRRVVKNKNCNYYLSIGYDRDGYILCDGKRVSDQLAFGVSSRFRANKFVRKQMTLYDETIDKYVSVYECNGDIVYGFVDYEYLSSNLIKSYITNGKDFTTTAGWGGGVLNAEIDPSNMPEVKPVLVPDFRDIPNNYDGAFNNYLKYSQNVVGGQVLYNSGIIDFKNSINGFVKGQQYVFRIKYGVCGKRHNSGRALSIVPTKTPVKIMVASYTLENGAYKINNKKILFKGEIQPSTSTDTLKDFQTVILTCGQGMSYKDTISIGNQLGIFISFSEVNYYYISEAQFFKLQYDSEGKMCTPDIPINAKVQANYYYYQPNPDYKSIEDVTYLYQGTKPNATFKPKYNQNAFEKIRSIKESESNRFNLIQSLCETFECWARFKIEHKANGEILLGKDSPKYTETGVKCPEDEYYRQQKWVNFYESIEQDNPIGFKYGINLQKIKRHVESDGIVSKIIVKNNSNEFGKDGFCSISRSDENYAKENFILDFSYYIQQGLLHFDAVTNDLYNDNKNQGYLGYYKKLRKLNIQGQQIIVEQSLLATDIVNFTSRVKAYQLQRDKTSEELNNTYSKIKQITGFTLTELRDRPTSSWWENDEVVGYANLVENLKISLGNQKTLCSQVEGELEVAQKKFNNNKEILDNILKEKVKHNRDFFKKYSHFIQEGSWISEDYIDDNLYYLDAESTLHTSSQPKVDYTIDVLELSQLEDYENYQFQLGDKTYVEDTEFFGWSYKDSHRTPYREEIIVTEITYSLDSPEQNTIKVQNYKTQFEDLFQRITATTQAVEFGTGTYDKVSNIIDQNGEIKFDTLQNSLINNSFIIQNSKDQTVLWDETGITTTSKSKPNEMVRIVSGGIFVSEDGGLSWKTGVTGKGINANQITSGQLNVSQVNILNGAFPSFRWDSLGLNAYSFNIDKQSGLPIDFNYGKFVRLDQYGLYGLNGDSKFDPNVPDKDDSNIIGEEKIKKYSNFSVTWSGFQIKSSHPDGGHISISSDKDFEVVNKDGKPQVKIGLLYAAPKQDAIYGLQLLDNKGNIVLEQASQGKVWIKDELKIGHDLSSVSIGYLPATRKNRKNPEEDLLDQYGKPIHQVINANNKFVVYEDGTLESKDGYFEGEGIFKGAIYATSGKIGNLTIGEIQDQVKPERRIKIISNQGDTFKINSIGSITPSFFQLKLDTEKMEPLPEDTIEWQYSTDFSSWYPAENLVGYNPKLAYNDITFTQGLYYLKAIYTTLEEGVTKSYEDYKVFYEIADGTDGQDGQSPIEVKVSCSKGNIFINNKESVTLIASVWQSNEDITSQFASSAFSWRKFTEEGEIDEQWTGLHQNYGTEVVITDLEIDRKAHFDCILNI